MKKTLLYLCIALAGMALLPSCEKENFDLKDSIFDTNPPERDSFDIWLLNNYTIPYNIRVYYLLKDIETSFVYNIVPADIEKAKQMSFLLKYLWLEAYEAVAERGARFVQETAPRIFHYVGSAEHDATSGTIRLGVAAGGVKITITLVNDLNPYNIVNQYYFSTIHHEFGHILNQRKDYPLEFNLITPADYAPAGWINRTEANAALAGFVTQYAGSEPIEDFVEVLARYLTWSSAQWEAKLLQAGTAAPLIEQKLGIVKNYMKNAWGVDLDKLKAEIQRRADEIQFMDLYNLGF